VISFPPIGYSFPYVAKGEFSRPEFNTGLLARLAQATGGEINPKPLEKLTKSSVSKDHEPLRKGIIPLAFCLFLLELVVRKFTFAEPD